MADWMWWWISDVILLWLWVVVSLAQGHLLGFRKPSHELPFKQTTPDQSYRNSGGQIYTPILGQKHRCRNGDSGITGSIWICECGRAYLNRNASQALAGIGSRRRYWWRINPLIPWHWWRVWLVHKITSDKYHLTGGSGGSL